jgi:hypothetical protein
MDITGGRTHLRTDHVQTGAGAQRRAPAGAADADWLTNRRDLRGPPVLGADTDRTFRPDLPVWLQREASPAGAGAEDVRQLREVAVALRPDTRSSDAMLGQLVGVKHVQVRHPDGRSVCQLVKQLGHRSVC